MFTKAFSCFSCKVCSQKSASHSVARNLSKRCLATWHLDCLFLCVFVFFLSNICLWCRWKVKFGERVAVSPTPVGLDSVASALFASLLRGWSVDPAGCVTALWQRQACSSRIVAVHIQPNTVKQRCSSQQKALPFSGASSLHPCQKKNCTLQPNKYRGVGST